MKANLKSVLETILFVHGEPLSLQKLTKFSRRKEEEVRAALEELKKEYQQRGFCLLENERKYQLGSNPDNSKYVKEMVKKEFNEELSRASLETLAIIAYQGPLPRIQIEYIRGVNSSFILRNLLLRGLIERTENPKDARSFLYKISFSTLRYLGVKKLEDLPQYQEFKNKKLGVLEELQPETKEK